MRILCLLPFLLLLCCQASLPLTNEPATLECLLDAFVAQHPPDNDELLRVLEGTYWTDTTSIIMVSTYKKRFLDQETTQGKQEASYRGYQVLYAADVVDGSKRPVNANQLIPRAISLSPFDTTNLPKEHFLPPYNPPAVQVIYNHETHRFEDVLLVTSSIGLPSCGAL